MSERLKMMGSLSIKEQDALKVRMKIMGLCKSIRELLHPVLLEVDDMDIAMAAQQMDELVMAHADYLATSGKIKQLKRELGHG